MSLILPLLANRAGASINARSLELSFPETSVNVSRRILLAAIAPRSSNDDSATWPTTSRTASTRMCVGRSLKNTNFCSLSSYVLSCSCEYQLPCFVVEFRERFALLFFSVGWFGEQIAHLVGWFGGRIAHLFITVSWLLWRMTCPFFFTFSWLVWWAICTFFFHRWFGERLAHLFVTFSWLVLWANCTFIYHLLVGWLGWRIAHLFPIWLVGLNTWTHIGLLNG